MYERPPVLKRALEYYSKKLLDLANDSELDINEILKNELIKKANGTKQVLNDLGSIKNFDKTVNGIYYQEVMCSALLFYIKLMKESLNAVNEELGINQEFAKLTHEIELAEQAQIEICKT